MFAVGTGLWSIGPSRGGTCSSRALLGDRGVPGQVRRLCLGPWYRLARSRRGGTPQGVALVLGRLSLNLLFCRFEAFPHHEHTSLPKAKG